MKKDWFLGCDKLIHKLIISMTTIRN